MHQAVIYVTPLQTQSACNDQDLTLFENFVIVSHLFLPCSLNDTNAFTVLAQLQSGMLSGNLSAHA